MVSLENSRNTKGGFSFDRATPINDDFIESVSINNDTVPLTTLNEPDFKQINTTLVIIIQILSIVLFEASVFLIPYFCGKNDENCVEFNGFDLALFVHAGFWFLKLIFDRFYHYQHMKSRRHGYLEFYRSTRFLRYFPLMLISAGNSLLIYLIKLMQKYCDKDNNQKCFTNLTQNNILQIFVSLECALLLPVLIIYLIKTIQFNRSKKSPDISLELDRPIFDTTKAKSVGARDSTYLTNILENQADMIRYLQERNKKLTLKLYGLTQNINTQNIN